MGKWFYGGTHAKAAGLCGWGGAGAGLCWWGVCVSNVKVIRPCVTLGLGRTMENLGNARTMALWKFLRWSLQALQPGKHFMASHETFLPLVFILQMLEERTWATSVLAASYASS